MAEVAIQISRARGLGDYQSCVELQKEVWGFTEIEDIAALPLLLIGDRYGGSVLVAEEPGGRIVGFSFALLSRKANRTPFWWSHMTAVSNDLQGQDVGFQLKLAQRQDALDNGIGEIRWTFDPLQAMNAHFNIRKLGVVVSHFEENAYGYSSSPLHHDLPTDRLLAEWHLESSLVTDRLSGNPPVILRDFDGLVRVFETRSGRPAPPRLGLDANPLLLEIPTDFANLKQTDRPLAVDWQKKTRVACQHYFERGYIITDFMVLDKPRPQALYVLENSTDG